MTLIFCVVFALEKIIWANIKARYDFNPLYDPRDWLDGMLKKYVECMMKKNTKGELIP